jgi:predicted Zn-dependent protease with MMP-like domain
MPEGRFEQLIEEGYEQLPHWVREKIKNVAVLVEDEPSEDVRRLENLGADETLLGYYQGIPLTERGEHYGVGMTLPDTITLFKLPILDSAAEYSSQTAVSFEDAVKKEIAETIWHEFAHHFGMDEGEVRKREMERS